MDVISDVNRKLLNYRTNKFDQGPNSIVAQRKKKNNKTLAKFSSEKLLTSFFKHS